MLSFLLGMFFVVIILVILSFTWPFILTFLTFCSVTLVGGCILIINFVLTIWENMDDNTKAIVKGLCIGLPILLIALSILF